MFREAKIAPPLLIAAINDAINGNAGVAAPSMSNQAGTSVTRHGRLSGSIPQLPIMRAPASCVQSGDISHEICNVKSRNGWLILGENRIREFDCHVGIMSGFSSAALCPLLPHSCTCGTDHAGWQQYIVRGRAAPRLEFFARPSCTKYCSPSRLGRDGKLTGLFGLGVDCLPCHRLWL